MSDLSGWKCPKCGKAGSFSVTQSIRGRQSVSITSDGERELMDASYSFVSIPKTATCDYCMKRIPNPEYSHD